MLDKFVIMIFNEQNLKMALEDTELRLVGSVLSEKTSKLLDYFQETL